MAAVLVSVLPHFKEDFEIGVLRLWIWNLGFLGLVGLGVFGNEYEKILIGGGP